MLPEAEATPWGAEGLGRRQAPSVLLYIAHSHYYAHPLPPGHRFPMAKYELIPEQLLYEGAVGPEQFFRPPSVDTCAISGIHASDYLHRLWHGGLSRREIRKIGFPYSLRLIEREFNIAYGTIQCTQYARQHGVACNVAGGTHHAYADRGEGFCLLNDIAIGAQYLLEQKQARRILVVDLDVHQGNGTAAIFRHRPEVFTFSMHGHGNYPLHKERSDLDIPLPDGCPDDLYLQVLSQVLPKLIETVKPDFVFFQSGVDVLAGDKLGRLSLSLQGCRERDYLVLSIAQRRGIPLVAVMGGGYSSQLRDIVEAHCNTYRLALQLYED
jgi:acetoin utilization deacetylase AcuC-like enzyme